MLMHWCYEVVSFVCNWVLALLFLSVVALFSWGVFLGIVYLMIGWLHGF